MIFQEVWRAICRICFLYALLLKNIFLNWSLRLVFLVGGKGKTFHAALGLLFLHVKPVYKADKKRCKRKISTHVRPVFPKIIKRVPSLTCFAPHTVSITMLSRSASSVL